LRLWRNKGEKMSTEITVPSNAVAGFFDAQSFELIQRVAKAFSSTDLVPKQYQGKVADCMIAIDMAQRIGASPLMVMQNLYIVHGNPGWSSKFLIATVNSCGRYSSLRYEWAKCDKVSGEYGCRAWAIERDTGERLDGVWVTWDMVRAEGWHNKNGSKWKTMPDIMFTYRAAAFWQRAYAPELGMGLSTAEEMHDVYDVDEDGVVTQAKAATHNVRDVTPEKKFSLTEMPQEFFDRNAPKWKVMVENEEATPQEIIQKQSLRYVLTAAQIDEIKAWGEVK
jgi:hypothetical protein